MVFIDERSATQRKTHKILITATDKFLSGCGMAKGGKSKCAWACRTLEEAEQVEKWVQNRSDMKYVNINMSGKWYPQAKHIHIYVVDERHPALN